MHELLAVHLPICVHVYLLDHLLHLLVVKLLSQPGHCMPPLGGADQNFAVLAKDMEGLPDVVLAVPSLHLPGHQAQELGEAHRAPAVAVQFTHYFLELGLGRARAQ